MSGILYLVATPIGNLEDMTYRAIRILGEVDYIAAEDTRNTVKLLNHFNIKKKLISYHEHNKAEKGPEIISSLLNGANVAVVSDAGTPGISDPGEQLVKLARQEGIEVTMIPGCSAVIMAVVLSGICDGKFVFEGFLPTNKKDKLEKLNNLKQSEYAVVFYEAPHKLLKTLNLILEVWGDRELVLCRELTKKFEEVKHTSISQAIDCYSNNDPRGEFVLVVNGVDVSRIKEEQVKKWEEISLEQHFEIYLKKGYKRNAAIKQVAQDRGVKKRDIYW